MSQTDSAFRVNDQAFIYETAAECSENTQYIQPESSFNAIIAKIDMGNVGCC